MQTVERHIIAAALENDGSQEAMQEQHGLSEVQFGWVSNHLKQVKRIVEAPIITSIVLNSPIPMSSLSAIDE
jgi:hypothetical protein